MSYVGGPGYELYRARPTSALTLYDALLVAPAPTSACSDAGYYTIDALRIEAGRRAWGAELCPTKRRGRRDWRYAVEAGQAGARSSVATALLRQRGARRAASGSCSFTLRRSRAHFRGAASRS